MESESLNENDVISLKEIILTSKHYLFEILNQWKLILLISILSGVFFFLRNKYESNQYSAHLSFMLEDNEGGGGSMISGLLGSFGLGKSAKGLNRDKLIELSRSERIIKVSLLKKVEIDGQYDYLANHLIQIYGFDKKWSEDDAYLLNGFRFQHDSISLFSTLEYTALKQLRSLLIGSPSTGNPGVFSSYYNDDSGILYLNAKSINPELSIFVVENIYSVLDSFFVTNAIEKQQINFEIIKQKTDSLRADIQATEYALAKFKDSGRNLFKKVDLIEESQLANKLKISYLALGKAIENQEIADYSLKYQKPLLSIIDRPFLPLSNLKQPFIFATLIGLIFGFLLGVFFVLLRKKFKEIMA